MMNLLRTSFSLFLAGLASRALADATPTPSPYTTLTVVVTPTPTIASDVPQFTNASVFTSAVLNSTNLARADFNASPIAWNQTLADFATSYLASMGALGLPNGSECNWSHSGGPYGENIALGCNSVTGCIDLCTFSFPLSLFLLRIPPTHSFIHSFIRTQYLGAQEEQNYNYSRPGFSEQTGHFTQLVWKDTTTVGCGSRLCGTRGWYLVCEYWPRGNVVGEFPAEVDPQVNGTGLVAPPNPSTTSSMRLEWYVTEQS